MVEQDHDLAFAPAARAPTAARDKNGRVNAATIRISADSAARTAASRGSAAGASRERCALEEHQRGEVDDSLRSRCVRCTRIGTASADEAREKDRRQQRETHQRTRLSRSRVDRNLNSSIIERFRRVEQRVVDPMLRRHALHLGDVLRDEGPILLPEMQRDDRQLVAALEVLEVRRLDRRRIRVPRCRAHAARSIVCPCRGAGRVASRTLLAGRGRSPR